MSTLLHQKLIIEVGLEHFCFAIKNEQTKEISYIKSFDINPLASLEPQLDTIFHEEAALHATYQEIIVLHNNTLQTLVPDALFDPTALGNYLQYTTKVYASDYFDYDKIEVQGCKNVFVPYIHYNNYLLDKLGEFTFKHFGTAFLSYVNDHSKSDAKEVSILLNRNQMHVVVMKAPKLLLYNTFEIHTPEDFVYYTLFVYEQLSLDPNQTPVTLMGDLTADDPNDQLLYKYIRTIHHTNHQHQADSLKVAVDTLQSYIILLHT